MLRRTIRIAIVALLLTATLHLDPPPPVDGGGGHPHPYSTTWQGETAVAVVPLIWSIRQTQSYTVAWDGNGEPTNVQLNWSYCKIDSLGVTISISWCGSYRLSPTRFDTGFNFVKSAFYIIGQQSCWVRATIWWTKGYLGPWHFYRHNPVGGC